MKKSKSFLLIITILSIGMLLISCKRQSGEEAMQDNSELSTEYNYEEHIHIEVHYDDNYYGMTDEDMYSMATHIICATYTGENETHGPYLDLKFKYTEILKGEDVSEYFYVRLIGEDWQNPYQKGDTHLLVLEKQISVYLPHDIYLPLGNAVQSYAQEELVEYVKEYLRENPSSQETIGRDFIRSEDLIDIVAGSKYIAKLTPVVLERSVEANNTGAYECRVEEVLKGTVTEETLKTYFFQGTVELGKSYIVMLDRNETSVYYTLSSQKSVYSAEDTEMVQKILQLLEIE